MSGYGLEDVGELCAIRVIRFPEEILVGDIPFRRVREPNEGTEGVDGGVRTDGVQSAGMKTKS